MVDRLFLYICRYCALVWGRFSAERSNLRERLFGIIWRYMGGFVSSEEDLVVVSAEVRGLSRSAWLRSACVESRPQIGV